MRRNEKSQSALEYLLLMGMVVSAIWMFCREGGPIFNVINDAPGGPSGGGGPGGVGDEPPPRTRPPGITVPGRMFGAPGGGVDIFIPIAPDIPVMPDVPPIGNLGPIEKDNHKSKTSESSLKSPGKFIFVSGKSKKTFDPATDFTFQNQRDPN